MMAKKGHFWIFLVNIAVFLLCIALSGTVAMDLSIKNATPLILLPLITAFSVFYPLGTNAVVGLLTGAALDSISGNSYCFNTIFFMLAGVVIYLIANNLFNKNLWAVTVMSGIISVSYYFIYWIVFNAFGRGIGNSLIYILEYGLPSAVYSTVFAIPLYYLYRYINKVRNK